MTTQSDISAVAVNPAASVPPAGSGTNCRLRISDAQHAWLAEIGVDRRLLAWYRAEPALQVRPATEEGSAAVPGTRTSVADSPVSRASTQGSARGGPELARAVLKKAGARTGAPGVAAHAGTASTSTYHADSAPLEVALAPLSPDLPRDLAQLAAHADACQACDLHRQRDRLVFGAGDAEQPAWLIVGEAPGKADDRSGQPFQGKAGRLLHAMLVAAGVHPVTVVPGGPSQVVPQWSTPTTMYFANLIKCRPLGNRSPADAEVQSCLPYLAQQIEILQPQRILVLGREAARALLQVDAEVGDLRGKLHTLTTASGRRIPLVVTWHPAALLLKPQGKADVWEDLQLAGTAVV